MRGLLRSGGQLQRPVAPTAGGLSTRTLRTVSNASSSGRRRAPCLQVHCNPSQRCGPFDSRGEESEVDSSSKASTSGSSIPGVPLHPDMQVGEEGVVLPGLAAFSQQPSGWIRWDAQRSVASAQTWDEWGDFDASAAATSSLPAPCNTPTTEDDFDAEHAAGFSRASSGSGSGASTGAAAAAGAALSNGASGSGRLDLWTLTDQPGIDLFLAGPLMWGKLKQVFVLLFGVGERDTEGIYSLRAFSEEGLPQETIIAFESEEDAQRYAGLLEATMDHLPAVCTIAPRELLDFCLDHGYNCRLEPTNSLLIPPDYNVGVTDWERSLRLRDGQWAVLPTEPDRDCGATASGGPGQSGWAEPGVLMKPQGGTALANLRTKTGINSSTLARYTGMSDGDLENIRTRLERLLPADSS